MAAFESDRVEGKYLYLLQDSYLLCIQTQQCEEAERVFSAAGYICSSIRSSLRDNTKFSSMAVKIHICKKTMTFYLTFFKICCIT